ncbi:MAG: hypothetical protein CBB68_12430 [Rhodospirillaceae bacterium TMED8]|nr:hypothetical protein [Magnetovibrio sp.]OUT48917.1 MAG: hypothetical protein CBB68_12430 [Rhodospirillaceae bacterium TMED8]
MQTEDRRDTISKRFWRMMRLRVIMPMLRARHSPEFTARGVAIGIGFGLTPTVGIQIPIVIGIWAIIRAIAPRWRFNLIASLAWVWLSNVFTFVPLYYAFLVTGRVIMGESNALPGYTTFGEELTAAMNVDSDGISALGQQLSNLFNLYGAPMLVGCLPWAVIGAWGGYIWTNAFLHRRQRILMIKRSAQGQVPDI